MNEYTLAISAKAECTTMLTKTCDDLALYCLLFKLYITFRICTFVHYEPRERYHGRRGARWQ